MTATSYAPEGIVSVAILLTPIILGLVSLGVSTRLPWTARLLAAPAVLMGLAFTAALFPNGPGYGGVVLLLYGPALLILGLLGLLRSRHRRDSTAN